MLNPAQLMSKGGARLGDRLVLTKPLGVGVITTAIKREQAQQDHVDAAIASMSRLNRVAGQTARAQRARAATDITGYGLLGHALEMAEQAGVRFRLQWSAIPFLPGAMDYAGKWIFAGGAETNEKAGRGRVQFADTLNDWQRMLLFDPQTSGGLLVALAPESAMAFIELVQARGEQAWLVGSVEPGSGIIVAE
jgi:selenide,water dikinase